MSQIEEVAAAIGGNVEQTREVAGAITTSKEKVIELATATANLGLEAKTTEANAIGEDLEQVAQQQTALAERLEQIRARVEALKGLQHGGSASGPPESSVTAPVAIRGSTGAGKWATPPKRNHGNPFNARYEQWVKVSNGGPDDEREYQVNGVWFDARRFEPGNEQPTEVLLDAKGQYDKFIGRDGDWQKFFKEFPKSGIQGLAAEARRQVKAADGQPVEWWCAEKASARLIRQAFNRDLELRGRVKVRYMPIPEEER